MHLFYIFLAVALVQKLPHIPANHIQKQIRYNGEVFDFIVVGGGTAGCAVACRLAESGMFSVLLIEAGEKSNSEMDVPALANINVYSNLTRVYETTPQKNAARANGGIAQIVTGKVLGGGSSINGMFFNRGSPHDYNNWAKTTSDLSWSYESLLKYFKKIETYAGKAGTDLRGYSGPISVSSPSFSPGNSEWRAAGIELGYQFADPNGPQVEGFAWVEYSKKYGRRISSYKGYIEPLINANQKNLHILEKTTANKIIFKEKQAVAVSFSTQNGLSGTVKATKEIIISAGAIGSSILLIRSGVGPKSVLDNGKVPVVSYLPVGGNLQDHVGVPNTIILGVGSDIFNASRDLTYETFTLYERFGDGPYSSTFGTGSQAFVTQGLLRSYYKHASWPNIHIFTANAVEPPRIEAENPRRDAYRELKLGEVSVVWYTLLTRPRSRGSLTLYGNNVDNLPSVDCRYLSHPDDMKAIVEGIKFTIKICEETQAFKSIGCRFPYTHLPDCARLELRSDSYWECYAKHLAGSGMHVAGTCKMGNDAEAVVDSQLRVHGLQGIRVVDASIMPEVTNTNTQAAVYVIAEKGADMILRNAAQ